MTRLIVPPLPAASRPSKTTTTRAPSVRTHSCSSTSSACSRSSSFSCSTPWRGLLTGLGRDDEAREASERALALAGNPAERELLARRLSF